MIQSLIHTTESNNIYLYDYQLRLSMLIHPEFEKAYKNSPEVEQYYLDKYKYLKRHNFFLTFKPSNFGSINESTVKDNICQTPQILFEVTDCCNLRCTYCGFGELYEGFDARNQKDIDLNSAISLLKFIFDLKPKGKDNKLAIGFYGGEPLLNIGFIKSIVETINQLVSGKELHVEYFMTTNATLLHKYASFLVDNKFNLLISLDGNKENHSYRFFGKGQQNSFSKVVENVDMLQKDFPDFFDKNVTFNAVLHDRNSVKSILEFVYTRYHKIPRISELSPDDTNSVNKDIYNCMFHSKYDSLDEYQKEGADLYPHNALPLFRGLSDFIKYFSINFYVSNMPFLLHDVERQLSIVACLPGQKKIFLTTRNKLLPCERINNKFQVGAIEENVSFNVASIAKRYNFYFDQMRENCQNCYDYRFCKACLFHMKNLDKLESDDFICEEFIDLGAFKNRLYHLFSFLEKNQNDFSEIIENIVIE